MTIHRLNLLILNININILHIFITCETEKSTIFILNVSVNEKHGVSPHLVQVFLD